MVLFSLIILGTISAFSNIAYCEEQAQLNQPLVDLELCLVWPWKKPTSLSRSILKIAVVKCQPHEACVQQPDTQIYGMEFGRCQPTTRPNATKDEIECDRPEDCYVDGFPMCIENKCVGFSWSPNEYQIEDEYFEVKDNGIEVHCKTDKYQTISTDEPVPKGEHTWLSFWFEVEITKKGRWVDDVIAVGLCRKDNNFNWLPGWENSSIGYHGDDGGIYIESRRMMKYTNETFKEAKIGVMISHKVKDVFFSKNSVDIDDMRESCILKKREFLSEAIFYDEVYPCVGFHFAKNVIVRISNYKVISGRLNDRSKEAGLKPGSCPFFPCADLCSFG